jgi:hypothetical protein
LRATLTTGTRRSALGEIADHREGSIGTAS